MGEVGTSSSKASGRLFFLGLLFGFSSGCRFLFWSRVERGRRGGLAWVAVKMTRKFKCLCCNEIKFCDARNRGRQRFCPKLECGRASKAASQRRWLDQPQNRDYFRGPENGDRVRQWRAAHPGYGKRSGNKKPCGQEPLQDACPSQRSDHKGVASIAISTAPDALQEICSMQPALLVGLIATVTGEALQEDIVAAARCFSNRGRDILRLWPGFPSPHEKNENQTSPLPRKGAARAAPV